MKMDEDYDDVPEEANFFSKRAKFVPKLSAEELKATSKLLEEIHEQRKKVNVTKDTKVVPTKKRGRRKGSTEDKCDKPEELTIKDDVPIVPSIPEVPLSAAAKRRLRKLQRERLKELKSVEDANEKVLSSLNTASIDDMEVMEIDNYKREKILIISYLSEISRLKYFENEKFSTIFPRVADLFKLNVSEFLLCLRDKNISVDDSPKSLNLVDSDILECIPYKAGSEIETTYDVDRLKLLFQASDEKKKTEMFVHKLEKMQNVMERYSKTRNIPLNLLEFEFDGEQISGTETPEDMDMESGNCVDVRVLNADDKQSRKATKRRIETLVDLTAHNDSVDSDIIFCD